MKNRVAAAGLLLALAAILFHWPGYGYDEVRRPFVILGAALIIAAGAGRGFSWLLRFSDVALLACAVSAAFAVSRTDAVAALFPAVAAWIVLRGTVLGWIPRPFLERHALFILACVGLLFSAYGVAQEFGLGRDRLAVSTLGNTNYAGVLAAAFAVAGAGAATFDRGKRRALGGAAALLCAVHVGITSSLGGLIGLAAGTSVLVALLGRRLGWKPVVFVPLFMIAAAVAPRVERLTHRVSGVARGEDRTGRVRLGLWRGAFRLAAAHPVLGCGPGNFRIEIAPHRDAEERRLTHEGREVNYIEAEDPHNSYLAILSECGPVALIALLAALGLALRAGFRRAREPDADAAGLAIAGTAGLVVFAVSGVFNSLAGHLPFAVLAGVFAGAASPVVHFIAPSRGARIGWIVAAFLLALSPWPWFTADSHYRDAMHTGSPEERLVHAQRAVSALPGHWQARFEIAMSWRALGGSEGSVLAELRKVLEVHRNHVWAMVELAAGLPPAEEEELLRRAEALAPEFVVVQNRLAGADLRRRDYAGARRRLERILKLMPDEIETVYSIARTFLWERKHDEALPWLKRAIAKNPKYRERLGDDHPELKGDSRFSGLMGP